MDAERGFQVVLLAITALLTYLLLRPYTTVILGAILLAYLLSTPYDWLAPKLGDRIAAIGLIATTLLVLSVPFVLIMTVVLDGLDDLLAALGRNGGLASFGGIDSLLQSVFGMQIDGDQSIFELLQQGQVLELAEVALDAFGGVSEAFVHLTILLFVWYYLLTDGDRLLAWIEDLLPLRAETQSLLVERADELMYVVVIGNLVVAVADGLLVAVGLWLVGFTNIIFWAFVAVFLAMVPLVGTMLIWVPAAAYLAVIGDVNLALFLFLWGFFVVGSIDNILRPFLGAPDVGLEPGIFVVGVLTGLTLFGVMGIFYGPVLLVMTKVVFDTVGQEVQ